MAKQFPDATVESIDAAIRRSGGYVGQAQELLSGAADQIPEVEPFVQSFAAKDSLGLLQVLVPMERRPRDQASPVFAAWQTALQEGLACRSGMPPVSAGAKLLGTERSGKDLLAAIDAMQKAIEYAQGNVSIAAICGWLAQTLR